MPKNSQLGAFLRETTRLLSVVYQTTSLQADIAEVEASARELLLATGAAHRPADLSSTTIPVVEWAETHIAFARLTAASIDVATRAVSEGRHRDARRILEIAAQLGVPSAAALLENILTAEAETVATNAREEWRKANPRTHFVPDNVGLVERVQVFEAALERSPRTARTLIRYLAAATPPSQGIPYRLACDMVTRIGQHVPTEGWAEYESLLGALAKLAAYADADPWLLAFDDAHLAASDRHWKSGQPLVDAAEVALTMFKGSTAAFVERLIDR